MKRISLAFVTGRASTRRNHPLNTPSAAKNRRQLPDFRVSSIPRLWRRDAGTPLL